MLPNSISITHPTFVTNLERLPDDSFLDATSTDLTISKFLIRNQAAKEIRTTLTSRAEFIDAETNNKEYYGSHVIFFRSPGLVFPKANRIQHLLNCTTVWSDYTDRIIRGEI